MGSQQGRKACCLQSLPPGGSLEASSARVAKVAGFSLHAGMAAARHERQKLERLCLQFRNSGAIPGQYIYFPKLFWNALVTWQVCLLLRHPCRSMGVRVGQKLADSSLRRALQQLIRGEPGTSGYRPNPVV